MKTLFNVWGCLIQDFASTIIYIGMKVHTDGDQHASSQKIGFNIQIIMKLLSTKWWHFKLFNYLVDLFNTIICDQSKN